MTNDATLFDPEGTPEKPVQKFSGISAITPRAEAAVALLLAERLRPSPQHPERLLGPARKIMDKDLQPWRNGRPFHVIFWGPPGCGKTTLARLLGESSALGFVTLSAVRDGVSEIRRAATEHPGCVLFIDEIHRLNKAQQDTLLPLLEHAAVWVVGATTESPQVSLTPAFLSRVRTLYVAPVRASEIKSALELGWGELNLTHNTHTSAEAALLARIAQMAQGDVRFAFNLLENIYSAESPEEQENIFKNTQRAFTPKNHADFASAMIKSMPGSDPDAALFYAFAALEGGEDPLFVLRRCIVFASEDVGNADPQALVLAVAALEAFKHVGFPEGRIPLAQIVTYLAATHKSNRSYRAIDTVRSWLAALANVPNAFLPPAEITLKGKDRYLYPHDFEPAFVRFDYLPAQVSALQKKQGRAYVPSSEGFEVELKKRLVKLWTV